MIRWIILLLLMISFSQKGMTSIQEDGNVNILLEGDETQIFVGDIASLTLTLWPMNEPPRELIESLRNGGAISESLYILSLEEQAFSENNNEAFQIKFNAVFLNEELPEQVMLLGKSYPLMTRSLKIKEIALADKVSFFSEIFKEKKITWFWLVLLISCLISVMIIFILKHKRKKRRELQIKKDKEYWLKKMESSHNRLQLENIYQRRKEWLSLFSVSKSEVKPFFQKVEDVQYKKSWSDLELEEIKNKLGTIKRKIS